MGTVPVAKSFPEIVLHWLSVAELGMGDIFSDTNFCPGNLGQCGAGVDVERGGTARSCGKPLQFICGFDSRLGRDQRLAFTHSPDWQSHQQENRRFNNLSASVMQNLKKETIVPVTSPR